jgi:hypothetical protein
MHAAQWAHSEEDKAVWGKVPESMGKCWKGVTKMQPEIDKHVNQYSCVGRH